jgi:DNA invertase Pin-like site-specific DNA recombinase
MAAEPGPEFRWGLVLRRSKYNLDGTEGSTRRQELALASHIKSNNMGRIVATYKDIASAYKEGARRPEYDAALIDLQAGRIDGIAVWRIDRLCRRASQYRQVLDVLEKSGGRLLSLVEGIDTAAEGMPKATTNIILTVLVELAEMEAEATSNRVLLMHEDRARAGLVQRGQVRPFGHTLDWFGLVPSEVELIREAARRILAGEGYWTIAKDWNRRGILSPSGKAFGHSGLRYVMRSPRLIAMREYGDELFDLTGVPPILDEDTWQRVQDVLNSRTFQLGRREQRLLSNIALCGVCDSPVIGGSEADGRLVYVCRKRPAQPNACGGVNATAEHVDARVAEEVSDFLTDGTRVAALLCQHAPGPEIEALHQREQELIDSLLALDQALKPPPGVPRMLISRYWTAVTEIEAERREVHRRLAVSREASLLAETLDFGEDAAAVWAERPVHWKRAILKLVTERIEIQRGQQIHRVGLYGTEFDRERVKVKFAA